jgi:hypothetical protein
MLSTEFNLYINLKELARDRSVIETLRSERYDVGISEAWNFGLFVVHHLIRLPTTIAISAQPIYPHLSYVSGLLEY